MKYLQNKTVLVLGLGVSGLAMLHWCCRFAAKVVVVDEKPLAAAQQTQLLSQYPQLELATAKFDAALITRYQPDYVLVSPGITPDKLTDLLTAAQAQAILVAGELWLFAQALQQLRQQNYQPKLLAISGTNGKTTVTALTAHLLQTMQQDVVVAGNIGPALLEVLSQRMATNLPDYWVLELSSFQLHWPTAFSADVATILNLSQDHLDWHGSFNNYSVDKANIFAATTRRVINRDEIELANSLGWQPTASSSDYSFGSDAPTKPGDLGIVTEREVAWLVQAGAELELQYLIPLAALKIKGMHNATNALAALSLLRGVGVELQQAVAGLRSYLGEPHRMQFVALLHEVEYFNDSKATNVGATLAALKGLAAERQIVLLLGGVAKGQDFTALVQSLAYSCRAVVLLGQDAALIAQSIEQQKVTVPVYLAQDMTQAVNLAATQAQSGDAVLLSPACASLDMYANYAERGDCFVAAVQELQQEAGNG